MVGGWGRTVAVADSLRVAVDLVEAASTVLRQAAGGRRSRVLPNPLAFRLILHRPSPWAIC